METLTTRQQPAAPGPFANLDLQHAILLTVLYGDVFDYPLTAAEIHAHLIGRSAQREEVERALEGLIGKHLSRDGNLYSLCQRQGLADLRRRRRRLAAPRWQAAERFARWLGKVPFLHMVGVCGSQAVENGDDDGDVDLFLVTEPGRLWLVQSITMAMRRLARLTGVEICPNYLLTQDDLAVEDHNLYTAHEAAQVVPLWGEPTYEAFVSENHWLAGFLPNADLENRRRRLRPRPESRLRRSLEWLLRGRLGNWLDAAIYRALLVYYPLRLRRHGFDRKHFLRAYRRGRQVVVSGGYGQAVAARFIERGSEIVGEALPSQQLESAFFGTDGPSPDTAAKVPIYDALLDSRYGASEGIAQSSGKHHG